MEVLRLWLNFPLPYAGITQTGSKGLPTPWSRDSQPSWAPLAIFLIMTDSFSPVNYRSPHGGSYKTVKEGNDFPNYLKRLII